jgi:hypothetical protein
MTFPKLSQRALSDHMHDSTFFLMAGRVRSICTAP